MFGERLLKKVNGLYKPFAFLCLSPLFLIAIVIFLPICMGLWGLLIWIEDNKTSQYPVFMRDLRGLCVGRIRR